MVIAKRCQGSVPSGVGERSTPSRGGGSGRRGGSELQAQRARDIHIQLPPSAWGLGSELAGKAGPRHKTDQAMPSQSIHSEVEGDTTTYTEAQDDSTEAG